MRIFLEKKEEFFKKYRSVNEEMKLILSLAVNGESFLSANYAEKLSFMSEASVSLKATVKRVFNLRVPGFEAGRTGKFFGYEKAESVFYWDASVRLLSERMEDIIEAGCLLFEIQELCREIASTRRRVNSLEYIMIPNLVETIRYIDFKLEEMDRSNTVRLMKVKEIVRSH